MRGSLSPFVRSLSLCLAIGGHLALAASVGASTIALLAVQNPAGDRQAATAVTETLRRELAALGDLADSTATRNALRRQRIRDGDAAGPEVLRGLAEQLGVDWLVLATVHDAERRDVPRLTLSARAYDGATGELFWAGFKGGSGLETRKLLGLGVIPDVETLVPRVVEKLVSGLGAAAATRGDEGAARSVAVLSFDGLTKHGAGAASETITEAARAAIHGSRLRLTSPNCATDALRRSRSTRRGAVDSQMRATIASSCGAAMILTGAVETYEVGGAEMEPEPRVSISMRLLDVATGRILWTGAQEREGWDRGGFFRLGRVYSRGKLVEQVMETLTRRLVKWENKG